MSGAIIANMQPKDIKSALEDLEITNYPITGAAGLEYVVTNKGNNNIWFIGQVLDLAGLEESVAYFEESAPTLVRPGETITVQALSGNPGQPGALLIGCYAEYE